MAEKTWDEFDKKIREIYSLRSALALLGWDQETKMPSRGGDGRANAMGTLSKHIQEQYCAPELGTLLGKLSEAKGTDWQQGKLREVKRDRDRYLKIPSTLTEEISRTASQAQQVWAKAKPQNDTVAFQPWLGKIMELHQRLAEYIGYQDSPYDAMLDTYEPGCRTSQLIPIFESVKKGIVPLLNAILEKKENSPPLPSLVTKGGYPIPAQKLFNKRVVERMTFNLAAGRLDESAHPFTEGIWPTDVRLTTRYDESDFRDALFSTIHEAGHGLYEQGFLPEHYGSPMAEAVSLGVHESQSRFWENQIGRSREFWHFYFPQIKAGFPEALGSFSLEDFYRAVNIVEPSYIRVDADEVTYNLHIIIRFEIEQALFKGDLAITDVEEAWNQKTQEVFGLAPPEPSQGYMQDVHWAYGLFGYFPTYTLGNLYSAQLYDAVLRDMPNLKDQVQQGELGEIREWLRKNVHQYGRRYIPEDLMKKATGKPLNPGSFTKYMTEKYTDIYELA